MTNFDQRLRDAGISTEDVETQIQSAETALLLTSREIVLLEPHRVQRGRLRDITGVKIIKTGELSVRSAVESMIEGNVLGFEKTERKLFFDAVKDATARAKASVTNATLPPLISPDSLDAPTAKSSADDWQALVSAPATPHIEVSATADFAQVAQPSHSVAPDPFDVQQIAAADPRSEPDFAPNSSAWNQTLGESAPDASDDPWKASKQTFEIEPEKPVSPADPWLVASADPPGNVPLSNASGWSDPFAANPAVAAAPLAAVTAVQTSNDDWGGDLLEASKALNGPIEKSDLERKVSALSGDNTSTLQAFSRWLKIMAVLFFLSGAAFTATLFPADTSNILGYFVLLSALFGSMLFSLIAWGLGELLNAYAISMQDLKAIRRAILGH